MLEFVDAARHARHIAYGIECSAVFLYHSDKGFGDALRTDAVERQKAIR